MTVKTCLNCGMHVDTRTRRCPKCDSRLDRQTDGSTITIDIAHHGERVHEAINKLHDGIDKEKHGITQYIRFIVGSGLIREEVMAVLADLVRRKVVVHQQLESGNKGAILVKLKH